METILRVFQLSKQYNQLPVLQSFSMEAYRGEVLGILGRSGSGKSTLCRILAGQYAGEDGKIYYCGKRFYPWKTNHTLCRELALVNSQTSLLPMMTVAQNLFLFSRERRKTFFIHERENNKKAEALLREWGLDWDPDVPVRNLPLGKQHTLETVKAVMMRAQIILYDEAALFYDAEDYVALRKQLARLRQREITVIYADSKPEPMMEFCDRIVLMEQGRNRGSYFQEEFSERRFGSILAESYEAMPDLFARGGEKTCCFQTDIPSGGETLRVQVAAGETVGLVETDETRRQWIAENLSGLSKRMAFPVWIDGVSVKWRNYQDAQKAGIGLLYGCGDLYQQFPNFTIGLNFCVPVLSKLQNIWGLLSRKRMRYLCGKEISQESLGGHSAEEPIQILSVDQRLSLYMDRLCLQNPKLLLIYDFGRGIDFISRRLLFQRMARECQKGRAFLLLSNNELDLTGICNRIYYLDRKR